tara:strand:- start:46 stop:363 length:318 start_codon:yes stop_codon:yes gene_type:complete
VTSNKKLHPGALCSVEYPFIAGFLNGDSETCEIELMPADIFLLIDNLEIEALGVIECQILFENKKMWFNIHKNDNIIEGVRRAASYDIPFIVVQEDESGSNTLTS